MEIKQKSFFILFFLIYIITGCKQSLSPIEYINYVETESSGLKKINQTDWIKYTLQYNPPKYYLMKKILNPELMQNITEEHFDSLAEGYSDLYFFDLKIENIENSKPLLQNRIENEYKYYERLNYFIAGAENSINIKMNSDSTPCVLYHFERTFDIVPYLTLNFGFKAKNISDKTEFRVAFDDRVLGTGRQEFVFKISDLKKIPDLKI